MKYSVVNLSEVQTSPGFRVDAEYWHPFFIANSKLVSGKRKVGDFVRRDVKNITSSPLNKDFEYLEISNISMGSIQYQTITVEHGSEPDRARYIMKGGDIAVSTVRPNRNAVAFIQTDGIIGSSGLTILRAENIEPEYLFAFCKTEYFINCLVRANKATMYPAVSHGDVLDTPLFLPSNELRSAIVDIVNNSLSCIRKAEKIFEEAQGILLLELGFADWVAKHCLWYVKNYSDTQKAGRLDAEYFQPKYEEVINTIKMCADGWDTLGNLVDIAKGIEVGNDEYIDAGIPFARVSNLSPFEVTEEKYISEEIYLQMRQYQPQKGEILFSKDATPGIACYLKDKPKRMIPSSGVLRLTRKSDKVNSEYLTLVLNSVLVKEQAKRDCGGSIILHWLPRQVKETVIPILSQEGQNKIQQKVSRALDLRQQSKHLLDCAKHATEIAITKNENEALRWLKENSKI